MRPHLKTLEYTIIKFPAPKVFIGFSWFSSYKHIFKCFYAYNFSGVHLKFDVHPVGAIELSKI
jgi:hypothetical protein